MDVKHGFLAVTEHRLIPARVRSEWARLKSKGVASIWAPASQDSSHVGNAGVGAVSLRGAPLSLPTSATAQFKRFFDCGRTVKCMLPLGTGRFMHLVVLYGYQGADADAEQLALTDHLFDAALGELSVTHNNTQQHTTTHNNTQQHTTTHNNTQQHTRTTHNKTQQQQQQQHGVAGGFVLRIVDWACSISFLQNWVWGSFSPLSAILPFG